MGCHHSTSVCEPHQLPPSKKPATYNLTSESITNRSLNSRINDEVTSTSTQSHDKLQEDQLRAVYDKYRMDKGLTNQMPKYCVRIVTHLLDIITMEENYLDQVTIIANFRLKDNEHFKHQFSLGCVRNTSVIPEHTQYSMEHRMMLHIMYKIQLHKLLLTYFEDGRDKKAINILNLVGLHHAIMKISARSIAGLAVTSVYTYLGDGLITEDQLPHVVYYLITIYECVADSVYKFSQRKIHYGNFFTARENYRRMRKWVVLLSYFRRNLTKHIAQMDIYLSSNQATRVTITNPEETEDDDWKTSREDWKILNFLKKGYKYRNMPKEMLMFKPRSARAHVA